MEMMISKLREMPYLIVLDSLECWDAVTKGDERTKAELNRFLYNLQGGRSLVVVVSNKKHGFLNEEAVRLTSYHLKSLEMWVYPFEGRWREVLTRMLGIKLWSLQQFF